MVEVSKKLAEAKERLAKLLYTHIKVCECTCCMQCICSDIHDWSKAQGEAVGPGDGCPFS